MKGPAVLTMMTFLALALVAYAEAAPRLGHHDRVGLFSRTSAATDCPLGTYYSSFYHACTHSTAQIKD